MFNLLSVAVVLIYYSGVRYYSSTIRLPYLLPGS